LKINVLITTTIMTTIPTIIAPMKIMKIMRQYLTRMK